MKKVWKKSIQNINNRKNNHNKKDNKIKIKDMIKKKVKMIQISKSKLILISNSWLKKKLIQVIKIFHKIQVILH